MTEESTPIHTPPSAEVEDFWSSTDMTSLRSDYFDASALVKVFTPEERSDVVRDYFFRRSTRKTTAFCFFETLSILKGKCRRKDLPLSREQYTKACLDVAAFYSGMQEYGEPQLDITEFEWLRRSMELMARHPAIDLSDAFQIVSVRDGPDNVLVHRSQTILVTADKPLAVAARTEGLSVWCIWDDPPPDAHDHSLWAAASAAR